MFEENVPTIIDNIKPLGGMEDQRQKGGGMNVWEKFSAEICTN